MAEERSQTDRVDLTPGTLMAPLPAVLVTVGDEREQNVFTVAWTGILCSTPPRTYISVRPQRHSHHLLMETGEFVIHLTTAALAYATDYSGIYTGAKVDKFTHLGLTRLPSKCVKAPTIAESPLAIECRVFQRIPMGTHDVFMADILNVSVRPELLDDKGRLMLERAGLMAYMHGEYYTLGEQIGKFGFSAAKPGKKDRKPSKTSPKNGALHREALPVKKEDKEAEEDNREKPTKAPFYLSVAGKRRPAGRSTKKGGSHS